MAAKRIILLTIALCLIYGVSFAIGFLIPQKGVAVESPVKPHVSSSVSWRNWEGHDPKWEKFQDEHPQYKYWETEVYRAGKLSVNRFYSKKR
jgi:hypothetical protein